MAREVNSRVCTAPLGLGSLAVEGTITAVHLDPRSPNSEPDYSVSWDDGKYPGELWSEQDFDPNFPESES